VRQSIFRKPRQTGEPANRKKVAPEGWRYFIRAYRRDAGKPECSFDFATQEEFDSFLIGEPFGRWNALMLMEPLPQAK
jgi:hypothetical protein